MGRGRAKAKQTKVARELKYSSPQTDFERLQRELSGSTIDDSTAPTGWPATTGPTRTTGGASPRTAGAGPPAGHAGCPCRPS